MSIIQIMLMVIGAGVGIAAIVYPNYKRMNLQKITVGMMYAFITKPGVRTGGLYPADDLTIDVPAETLKGGKQLKGKEQGILSYTLIPDAIEPTQYPIYSGDVNRSWFSRWFNPTVTVRSIMLVEGYGIPIIPSAVDPITGKYIIPEGTAAAYINAFKDQANAGALSRKSREYTEGVKATGSIKKSSFNHALIGIVIAAIGALVGSGLGYLIYTEVIKITTGFGL